MTAEERVERLQASVQRLLTEIDRLPADVLYREPSAGEWPVMSTLAHLAELLPYWAHQAEGVARSPESSFGRTHADPDRIGAVEQHGHDSLETAVARIRTALEECVTTLRRIPADAWTTIGHSPTRGTMSVEQIVDRFLVDHAEEHAAQTQATLSALRAIPRS
jgi:uncharacterized damage-inducible protein DinB